MHSDLNVKMVKSMKQPRKLLQYLNHSLMYSVSRCNTLKCKTCPIIIESRKSIMLNNYRAVFNSHMNCTTKNCIYVLKCDNCSKLYVGETSLSLRLRINLHRQHINHNKYGFLKVSKHIQNCGSKFSVIPIFKLFHESEYVRKKIEHFFINKIKPELNSTE